MEIARRTLFQGLAASAVAVAAAQVGMHALSPLPIDPLESDREFGMALHILEPWKSLNGVMRRVFINILWARAEKDLAPGSRFDLRLGLPMDYGRRQDLAWYRHAFMDREAEWPITLEIDEPPLDRVRGLYMIGRLVT